MSETARSAKPLTPLLWISIRARDEGSERTWPAVLFLFNQCRSVLSVSLDPEWQAQIVAGQLRPVG